LLTYGATFGYGRKWKNVFRSVSVVKYSHWIQKHFC